MNIDKFELLSGEAAKAYGLELLRNEGFWRDLPSNLMITIPLYFHIRYTKAELHHKINAALRRFL